MSASATNEQAGDGKQQLEDVALSVANAALTGASTVSTSTSSSSEVQESADATTTSAPVADSKDPAQDATAAAVAAAQAAGGTVAAPSSSSGKYKLFVGQIPNNFDVDQLRPIFEPFGTVDEVVVLKDRFTGAHKGCGFIIYSEKEAADKAILGLNDKISLGQGKRNMVVRYAQNHRQDSNGNTGQPGVWKLFVGMLAKTSDENRIRQIFEQFGPVQEVYLMKDHSGTSKGCAFVKYGSRDHAVAAISQLHEVFTDEPAPRPLNVRFADTHSRQNNQFRQFQPMNNFYGNNMYRQGGQGYGQFNQFGQQGMMQQMQHGGMQPGYGASAAAAGMYGPKRDARGPPGANLFVYNIPESFGDNDLASLFMHFGQIVSTKVFIDKMTGMSRGFGFVSYQSPQSAEQAIAAMNGFEVGNKRLKVALKTNGQGGGGGGGGQQRFQPY